MLSAQGKIFSQKKAKELAKMKNLIFICGHYEGIDERILKFADEEISIGNYVLTGGEIPAMVIIDSTVRLIPGAVKEFDSIKYDSFFEKNILGYPLYTRPGVFKKMKVPKVLLSGNHKKISEWREKKSIEKTLQNRPDLLEVKM